ncbi:MAG: hypothetical protein GWP17_00785 [Aquificales bacterium]|nr:hypothetical protein [Aquificales bacterium]
MSNVKVRALGSTSTSSTYVYRQVPDMLSVSEMPVAYQAPSAVPDFTAIMVNSPVVEKETILGASRMLRVQVQMLKDMLFEAMKRELDEDIPAWYERVLEDAAEAELETMLFPPDEYDDVPDKHWEILDQY